AGERRLKAMIIVLPISGGVGLYLGDTIVRRMGEAIGLSCRDTTMILLVTFPFVMFCMLYGFYKALVKYYGLNGPERLFFF
ncbi:MAG TPA: hypothetical protein VF247_02705, partial [Candidatus Krumholzibacteria bacterium]